MANSRTRIIGKISSKSAENYYYEKDQIRNSENEGGTSNVEWHGNMKEVLGIDKTVDHKEFKNLLEGKDLEGTQLLDRTKTLRKDKEEIAVFDIPLSAPKSVSLAALANGGDKNILEAHDKAVAQVAEFLEKNYAQVTTKNKGENGETIKGTEKTDNMLIAVAKHSTARPNSENGVPEAHLHSHTLVFNMTYDAKNDKFKALDTQDLIKDQSLIIDVYRDNLERNLKNLGYETENKGGTKFELKGYSEEVISEFSSGRNAIKNEIAKREAEGKTIGKQEEIGIQHTLKGDKTEHTASELKDNWDKKAESINVNLEDLRKGAFKGIDKNNDKSGVSNNEEVAKRFKNVEDLVKIAGNNLAENQSFFTSKELYKEAVELNKGEFRVEDIKKSIENISDTAKKDNDLMKLEFKFNNQEVFTTKENLDQDNKLSENLKGLVKEERSSIMTKSEAIEAIGAYEESKKMKLTNGQFEAAVSILSSNKAVTAIQGDAGTGKSTAFAAVSFALEYQDKKNITEVTVAAPTNVAVKGAVDASKISDNDKGFTGSTVHKLTNFDKKDTKENAERVKDIAKNLNEVHIGTGAKAFSNKKAFSLDPANSIGVKVYKENDKNGDKKGLTKEEKGKNIFEVSASSKKTTRDSFSTTKNTKIQNGEFKGSLKVENFKVSQGGDKTEYTKNVKLNTGEEFSQKVVNYNPLKLGGEAGSPLSNIGQKLIGFKGEEKKSSYGTEKTNEYSLAGLSYSKKVADNGFAKENTTKVSALFVGSLERSNYKTDSKNVNTETATVFGFKQKTAVEVTRNKNGDITGKVLTQEKSFLGITFGKTTIVDKEGSAQEFSYTKISSKMSEPKLQKEFIVDMKDTKQIENLDKGYQINEKNKLILIDESSMLSTKDMNKILDLVKNDKEMKVVFVGDEKQLQSIGAGNAFKKLLEKADTVVMNEGQRQRNTTQKEITDLAAAKDIKNSIEKIDNAGGLKEVKGYEDRIKEVVKIAISETKVDIKNFSGETKSVDLSYKNTLILAATNKENTDLNNEMRSQLKDKGLIKNEIETTIDKNISLSATKIKNADNYNTNMKLQSFDSNSPLKVGAEYTVKEIDKKNNKLTLETVDKKTKKVETLKVDTLKLGSSLSISESQKRQVGEGDKIIITKTDKKFMNSEVGEVIKMEKNGIAKVKFGEKDIRDFDFNKNKNWENGFSMTVHKAQGISVDRVVALVDTEKNQVMNSLQSFYVSISRQKADSFVVTDNKEALKDQVSKEVQNRSIVNERDKISEKEALKNGINNDKSGVASEDKVIKEVKEEDKINNKNDLLSKVNSKIEEKSQNTGSTKDDKNLEALNVGKNDSKEVSKDTVVKVEVDTGKIKAEAKITLNDKDQVKDIEVKREATQKINSSELNDKIKEVSKERGEAKFSSDNEKFNQKQNEFMNLQIVGRNGYNEKSVREFADSSVKNGYLTKENADQFVLNSNKNANDLVKAGILKIDSNEKGAVKMSFTDNKSKEILNKNFDKGVEKIGSINEKDMNKTIEKIAEKIEQKDFKAIGSNEKVEKVSNDLVKNADKLESSKEISKDSESLKNYENGSKNKVDVDLVAQSKSNKTISHKK
ncbi:MobF family relaxase [Aliarcobacter butzleri]|uniref:MobF family relaxase n=1 Tax=Aliarcobacter butzleri TaxID=28197 RepID=UPI0021B4D354|nr:MobF family relaxase [Aliarcobacter butzleri]MCT7632144.1 relaxase domain-containing protein [Aliarcobacter butzleri]